MGIDLSKVKLVPGFGIILLTLWKGAGVAKRPGLENRGGSNSYVGSNPTPSAPTCYLVLGFKLLWQE